MNVPATATRARRVDELPARQRVAYLLDKVIYVSLLIVLALPAIAYGGSEPWLKAFFTCLIFIIGFFAAGEMALSDDLRIHGLKILLPIVALVIYSLLQTIALPQSGVTAGINYPFWNAISADPYETRVFALELFALALLAAMLFRYANSERRLRLLLQIIIGIALASAVFGLLRQTMQHQPGFLLSALKPDTGYGQFINKNHFAYVMEIGFGLALGLVAGGGVTRDRLLIYLAVMLPIWTALVLSNSRGGILAMLVQLIVTLLLCPTPGQHSEAGRVWKVLRGRTLRVVLVAGMVAMVLVGVLWVGGDRLASSIEATRGDESSPSREGVTRVEIWRATLRLIKANPILGVGAGGYWAAIPTYHAASGTMTPQQAHNDYLEIVASVGLAGLPIFVWFAITVVKKVRFNFKSKNRFRRAACFAASIAIAGVAVHSLVDFGLHRMLNAMLFTAVIVAATSNSFGEGNRLKVDA